MKDKKKIVNVIMVIIVIYLVVGIILPFIFKYVILKVQLFLIYLIMSGQAF